MDKSNIKRKLDKLADDNKIQSLFLDEESQVSIILDLDTIEYEGVYLKYRDNDRVVEINTAISSLKINNNGEIARQSLDDLLKAHIDKVAVDKFNINKLDEDYFNDLEEVLEEKIADLNNQKSQKILDDLKKSLEEIHESNYDYQTIYDKIKRFEIIEKSNHYILEKHIATSKVKYNTGKGKVTVKNIYDFKEKFRPEDYINDFDEAKFVEIIKQIIRKKKYELARMELEDGVDEPYPSFSPESDASFIELDTDYDL